jgi:hypothetical protein
MPARLLCFGIVHSIIAAFAILPLDAGQDLRQTPSPELFGELNSDEPPAA